MSHPSGDPAVDGTIQYTPAAAAAGAADDATGFHPSDTPESSSRNTHVPRPHLPGRSLFRAAGGAAASTPAADLIGPYEVVDELGKGGMGVVYRARHTGLNRTVALKMILAGPNLGATMLSRFRTEAEAVARLSHPGIVQVYDVGDHAGQPYMAMELIDGGTLAERAGGKPQNARWAAQVVETIARAIAVAHQFHVVHRDLKPGNVLLTRDGQPKVTDFGLAKDLDRDGGSHTRTGSILGTPSYMAPEQAAGRVNDIGPCTDVYAIGAILYELLTGRPPFRGESPIDTIRQVLDGELTPPRQLIPKVPRDLDTICIKALQKPVHRRYPSADALAEDLRRFLDGEPIKARPIGPAERAVKWVRRRPTTAAMSALGLLAFAGFLALGTLSYLAIQRRAKEAEVAKGEAEAAVVEGNRRMIRLNVANGTRLLDDGDYLPAVLWFAEALRLEKDGPDRERVHRLRLKAVVDRCQRPVAEFLHESALTAAGFSRDGRKAFTASDDGVVRVWDADTGRPAGPPLEHGGPARYAALSPDGRWAATAGGDGVLRVRDTASGGLAFAAPLAVQFTGVVFTPDSAKVIAIGAAGRARVWEAATGADVSTVTAAFGGPATAVAVAPDGKRFAVASRDGTARVFDTATSQPVGPPLKHLGPVLAVAYFPDGAKLATGSADGTAQVWDAATGAALLANPPRHPAAVNCVAVSPDGTKLATGSDDRTAQAWDAVTGLPVGRPALHDSRVHLVEFGPDGWWYGTGSDDNSARGWDAATGDPVGPPLRYSATPVAVKADPSGYRVLIAAQNRLAELWDFVTPAALAPPPPAAPPAPANSEATQTAVSPDGKLAVSFGGGQAVRVRATDTHEPVAPPLRTGGAVGVAAFSPDGTKVVTGDDDGGVQVWAAADAKPLWESAGRHASKVSAVAFSPDGSKLATGGEDNSARVWDAVTGKLLVPPVRLGASAAKVAFDPTGRVLYTVTVTDQARVWDAATGEPLAPPDRPRPDWADRLTPDGRPAADLLALGRVLAGQKLTDTGDVLPLDPAERRDEWRKLTAAHPDLFATSAAGLAEWRRRQAAASEKAGRWFAAAWNLDKLIQTAPDDADVRRRRVAAAVKLGDWQKAAADADAAVRLDPVRADAWYLRAQARGRVGKWDEAAADFAKAVELRADPDAAVGLAARVKLAAGDKAGYRALTRQLVDAHKELKPSAVAARRAAWACALSPDSGADSAAVLKLAEAVAAALPSDPEAAVALGLALVRAGRADEAAGQLAPLCESPTARPTAWLAYSLALARLGKADDARVWREKAGGWLWVDHPSGSPPPGWDGTNDVEVLLKEAEAAR